MSRETKIAFGCFIAAFLSPWLLLVNTGIFIAVFVISIFVLIATAANAYDYLSGKHPKATKSTVNKHGSLADDKRAIVFKDMDDMTDEHIIQEYQSICDKISKIPFESLILQYVADKNILLMFFNFPNDYELSATYYFDNDDKVYYSVCRDDELLFKKDVPVHLFFDNVKTAFEEI